jgi:hypothetical protein
MSNGVYLGYVLDGIPIDCRMRRFTRSDIMNHWVLVDEHTERITLDRYAFLIRNESTAFWETYLYGKGTVIGAISKSGINDRVDYDFFFQAP